MIMHVQAWCCVRPNGGHQVNLDTAGVSCADGTGRLKAALSIPHGPVYTALPQSQVEGRFTRRAGNLCELRIAAQPRREQAVPPPGVGSASSAWNFTARGTGWPQAKHRSRLGYPGS